MRGGLSNGGQSAWVAAGDQRCSGEQRREQGFGSGSRERGRATTRAAHLLVYAGGKCERLGSGGGSGGGIAPVTGDLAAGGNGGG